MCSATLCAVRYLMVQMLLPVDVETLVVKIFQYFYICTVSVEALKHFFSFLEFEYQQILDNSFIDTNLIHNFLYKLHKIKLLYMFQASSAHLQEVNDVNCTCMQPLVFSFSAGGRLVHLLRGVCP